MVKFEINPQVFKDLLNNAGLATDQKADHRDDMYRGVLFKVTSEHIFNMIATNGTWISVQQYYTPDEFPLEVGFQVILDYLPLSNSLKPITYGPNLSLEISEESITWKHGSVLSTLPNIEDKYRDYASICKVPESLGHKVTFNAKLVSEVLKTKIPGKAVKEAIPEIDMVIEADNKPMRFYSQGFGWKWYAMVMPVRSSRGIHIDTEVPFEV